MDLVHHCPAVIMLGWSTRSWVLLLVLKQFTSFLGLASCLQVMKLSGDPRALSEFMSHVVRHPCGSQPFPTPALLKTMILASVLSVGPSRNECFFRGHETMCLYSFS